MKRFDAKSYLASSKMRLIEARLVADRLKHDRAVHRLAMLAVFVLEDVYETLLQIERSTKTMSSDHSVPGRLSG